MTNPFYDIKGINPETLKELKELDRRIELLKNMKFESHGKDKS